MKIDLPIDVARDCIPSLNRAIAAAERRAEQAILERICLEAEGDYCLLDCLLRALTAAIKADEADCARMVAEAEASRLPAAVAKPQPSQLDIARALLLAPCYPASDCDPVTGQEYGTGA